MSYVVPKTTPVNKDYAKCGYSASGDFTCGNAVEGFTCYDAPGAKTSNDPVFPMGEYFTYSGAPIEVNYPPKDKPQSCS